MISVLLLLALVGWAIAGAFIWAGGQPERDRRRAEQEAQVAAHERFMRDRQAGANARIAERTRQELSQVGTVATWGKPILPGKERSR